MTTPQRVRSILFASFILVIPQCVFAFRQVPARAPLTPEALVPLSAIPLEQRQFSGTLEDFKSRLPGYIQRAASVGGLPEHDYTDEVAYIGSAVSTCLGQSEGTGEFRTRTGLTYVACDGSVNIVPRPYGGFKRTLAFLFTRTADQEVVVSVYFRAYPGDAGFRGNLTALKDNFDRYGIVSAALTLTSSGSAGVGASPATGRMTHPVEPNASPDGFRFLLSMPADERRFEGSERGFEQALSNVMRKAVVAGNLLIDTYKNDLPIIFREVKLCGGITQAKADSVNGKVWRLNSLYGFCDGNSHSAGMEGFTTMNPNKRRLFMTVVPQPEGWGHGLVVTIDFQHLPEDRLPNNVDMVPYFRVLQASIR